MYKEIRRIELISRHIKNEEMKDYSVTCFLADGSTFG